MEPENRSEQDRRQCMDRRELFDMVNYGINREERRQDIEDRRNKKERREGWMQTIIDAVFAHSEQ